jgi:hypothetical protein
MDAKRQLPAESPSHISTRNTSCYVGPPQIRRDERPLSESKDQASTNVVWVSCIIAKRDMSVQWSRRLSNATKVSLFPICRDYHVKRSTRNRLMPSPLVPTVANLLLVEANLIKLFSISMAHLRVRLPQLPLSLPHSARDGIHHTACKYLCTHSLGDGFTVYDRSAPSSACSNSSERTFHLNEIPPFNLQA